ncbi:MAG: hypothetical protein KF787_03405 [Phycisphaeraceae bacterium]|nr:hypothetical protein [Phycisphaerae bacterium]MBX3391674.1 hypothetical protein [Phycisphaeraceae bacterium]
MILHATRVLAVSVLSAWSWAGPGGVTFSVSIDPSARSDPATGRLIVMLVGEGSRIPASKEPLAGPFWEDPQPMFGIDVAGLSPGVAAVVDDAATSFPCVVSALPPGRYRAQARLDTSRTNSDWKREAGNLYSGVVTFEVTGADRAVSIVLDKSTKEHATRRRSGVELFSIRSESLSSFYGREVNLRAAVAYPLEYAPGRAYAAIYSIPGYGGDHGEGFARDRSAVVPGSAEETVARNTFMVYLDPESPNGHTLFADSANNGPWGSALVGEFIPALEERYKTAPTAAGRLVRGHSSGGWSALWLALTYPDTFGSAWSGAPDPVDFRRFQVVDLYGDDNMYLAPGNDGGAGGEHPSFIVNGRTLMTIRQENLMEEVIGPGNTSAQQWDSWFAVFGPRGADGKPAALFDPVTGAIDRAVAEEYRRYDIGHLVRSDPARYVPILRSNVRLVVGDRDNFSLYKAVELLAGDVKALSANLEGAAGPGYIVIEPGFDHGSVSNSPAMRRMPAEIVEHLKKSDLIQR